MAESLPEPEYDVTADMVFLPCAYKKGARVKHLNWANPQDLQPANESARRIADYRLHYGAQPGCPQHPHNEIVGDIFLPYSLECFGSHIFGESPGVRLTNPIRKENVLPGMPLWKIAGPLPQRVGTETLQPGEEFYYLGWPELPHIEPANEAAQRVYDYYRQYGHHPKLLTSPWCCYRRALVLPDLPGRVTSVPAPYSGFTGRYGPRGEPICEESDEVADYIAERVRTQRSFERGCAAEVANLAPKPAVTPKASKVSA